MTTQIRSRRLRTITAGGLLAASALSTAACQQEVSSGATGDGGQAPTSSASNPNANQPGLTLTDDGGVNSIRLAEDESSLRPQVNAVLGTPERSVGQGCPLGGEPGRLVTLKYRGGVTFSGEAERGQPLQITSWSIDGYGSEAINAPHSIYYGDSASKVRANVPGVKQQDGAPFNDGPVLTKGDMQWWLNSAGTEVKSIHYNLQACD